MFGRRAKRGCHQRQRSTRQRFDGGCPGENVSAGKSLTSPMTTIRPSIPTNHTDRIDNAQAAKNLDAMTRQAWRCKSQVVDSSRSLASLEFRWVRAVFVGSCAPCFPRHSAVQAATPMQRATSMQREGSTASEGMWNQ